MTLKLRNRGRDRIGTVAKGACEFDVSVVNFGIPLNRCKEHASKVVVWFISPMTVQIAIDESDRRLLEALQENCALTNDALAKKVHISPATCMRRVKRLVDSGVIERQIALVSTDALGRGLTALLEVTLDRQSAESLTTFEGHVAAEIAVQQCYRVSGGPDFVLVVYAADMDAYHAFVHRALTATANVRNVRAFFSVKRSKFEPRVAIR